MIIAISGFHGTGKSTVGKLVAESLGIKYYSTGQAFRDLANKKKMSLEEFTKYVEDHPEIDKELDNRIVDKAKEGDILIDSQLSGHILNAIADFKVHLICSIDSRVKRMMERDKSSFIEKLNETKLREKSELDRFYKLYNIDLSDKDTINELHDMVINTENLTIEEVVEKIISKIKKVKQ